MDERPWRLTIVPAEYHIASFAPAENEALVQKLKIVVEFRFAARRIFENGVWESSYTTRDKSVPEESVYQTILCNAGLRICPDNLRYADWSDGGSHPRLLSREDIPAFAKTNAHLDRKSVV